MRRPARTDRIVSAWLVAALAVMAVGLAARGALPQPLWTMVHVVTLGVLTNGILQWSWYFARALLHLPADDRRAGRDHTIRDVAFNAALVGLVAAMWTATTWATVAGAGAVGAVTAWHGLALLRAARTRLASRFAVVIRYYVAAAGFLVVGCVLAGFLTVAMFAAGAPGWLLAARDDLTLAHAVVNLGGWVGLSMAGTLVTLGPTMLRTRMDPAAVERAIAALPWLAAGIAVAAGSAAAGFVPGVGVGLLAFAAALVPGVGLPLVRAAVARSPRGYPTWTASAGLTWIAVAVAAMAAQAFTAADATALREANLPWLALLGAGGLAQVFVGALAYLMPVVIGGGPGPVRVGIAVLEAGGPLRVALRNAALTLLAATAAGGTAVRTAWWVLVLVAYGVDVALFAVAGARQARARRAASGADVVARTPLGPDPISADAVAPHPGDVDD